MYVGVCKCNSQCSVCIVFSALVENADLLLLNPVVMLIFMIFPSALITHLFFSAIHDFHSSFFCYADIRPRIECSASSSLTGPFFCATSAAATLR